MIAVAISSPEFHFRNLKPCRVAAGDFIGRLRTGFYDEPQRMDGRRNVDLDSDRRAGSSAPGSCD